MICGVAYCPYCGELSAGVDVDRDVGSLAFVLAPDRADGRPCPHLAFVVATVSASDPRTGKDLLEQSRLWLWVRGEGTRLMPSIEGDRLGDHVHGIVCGSWAAEGNPSGEHRITGATALGRERNRPGSGAFRLRAVGRRRQVDALLDGWGMYAPDPDALVAEVRRLARVPSGGAENLK